MKDELTKLTELAADISYRYPFITEIKFTATLNGKNSGQIKLTSKSDGSWEYELISNTGTNNTGEL